jgi:hypothetical protein
MTVEVRSLMVRRPAARAKQARPIGGTLRTAMVRKGRGLHYKRDVTETSGELARADPIESRVEFEAGPAANNPGPRAVLRRHAPSATRQRTLEANGIDCGAGPVHEAVVGSSRQRGGRTRCTSIGSLTDEAREPRRSRFALRSGGDRKEPRDRPAANSDLEFSSYQREF